MSETNQEKENRTAAVERAVLMQKIEHITSEVSEIKRLLETQFVRSSDFAPVKNLVYGMVSILLTGVLAGLVALIIKRP